MVASGQRSSGRPVDLKSWKRRDHFELYRRYQQPFFSTCIELGVTPLWNLCQKPNGPPFFLTSLFLMLKAVNETEAFRLRLRKRGVWLHNSVAVGPTVPRTDETFGFARIEHCDSLKQFLARGRKAIDEASKPAPLEAQNGEDDIVYHSTLPWFRFTSFTNALPGGSDSIPRIVFGKCSRDRGGMRMPVAVEVHHALVDGLDVARFIDRFQAELQTGGGVGA